MAQIVVIVPTTGRAQRLEGVARNIRYNSSTPVSTIFVIEEDDAGSVAETARLAGTGLADSMVNTRGKSYAGAVNTAVSELLGRDEPGWFFLGADDLHFWPDWDEDALERAARTGALVTGTNDMRNPYVLEGTHSTHSLVHRSYASDPRYTYDPGMAGQVLFEGYGHNFTDAEFIGAAQAAGVFTPCLISWVEHRHADWQPALWDETYAKSRLSLLEDLALFRSREHLWTDTPAHAGEYERYCDAQPVGGVRT